jgi:hypothetical protein
MVSSPVVAILSEAKYLVVKGHCHCERSVAISGWGVSTSSNLIHLPRIYSAKYFRCDYSPLSPSPTSERENGLTVSFLALCHTERSEVSSVAKGY